MSSWKGVLQGGKGLLRNSTELKGQEGTLQSCPTVMAWSHLSLLFLPVPQGCPWM